MYAVAQKEEWELDCDQRSFAHFGCVQKLNILKCILGCFLNLIEVLYPHSQLFIHYSA